MKVKKIANGLLVICFDGKVLVGRTLFALQSTKISFFFIFASVFALAFAFAFTFAFAFFFYFQKSPR